MGHHKTTTGTAAAVATVQRYSKGIAATVGALLTSGAFVLPDNIAPWVSLGMAALTAVATVAVPTTAGRQEQSSAGYPDALKTEPADALG